MAGLFDASKPLPIPEIGTNIINSQSDKVPFLRMVKKGPVPKQMLQSWPVEEYPDRGFLGTLDGVDVTSYSHFTRAVMESYAMLLRTGGVQVSKLANLTVDAGVGRKQEIARQIMLDGKVLAQMMERACLSQLDHRIQASSTPYRTRGAFQWLNPSAQAQKPVPAAFRPPAAAARSDVGLAQITDTVVESMLEAMAVQKKGPVDLKCIAGLKAKRAMSLWGQKVTGLETTEQAITSMNLNAADKRLLQVIDKFEFDSGVFYSMVSFYLATDETSGEATDYTSRSALFLDTSMWRIGYLQEPQAFTNPDLGGGPRAYHDTVFVLQCLNTMGQGYILSAQDSDS
jgi:hypothetical protein